MLNHVWHFQATLVGPLSSQTIEWEMLMKDPQGWTVLLE